MNIHGQSKLPASKQLQIEDFIKYNSYKIAFHDFLYYLKMYFIILS